MRTREILRLLRSAAKSCDEAIDGTWEVSPGGLSADVVEGFRAIQDSIQPAIDYFKSKGTTHDKA
jgi:hypothetical protein